MWDSSVAIVLARRPNVHPFGSASLFEVAGARFVVTAAHNIQTASLYDRTIGLSTPDNSVMVPTGNWIVSTGDSDPVDVAVYRLSDDECAKMRGARYLRFDDLDFGVLSSTAVFCVCGYPGKLSSPSGDENEPIGLGPLQLTLVAYNGPTDELIGYSPALHVLLDSEPEGLTSMDGSKCNLVDRSRSVLHLPLDFRGISGCAIWRIGDLTVPVEHWPHIGQRVAAVDTGVYSGSKIIRGTRWNGPITLIYEAFPDLRPAIELYSSRETIR